MQHLGHSHARVRWGGGAPSQPAIPPIPAPPADPPQMADKAVSDAATGAKAKAAAARGYASTILTGGQGLTTPATTTSKELLGQ